MAQSSGAEIYRMKPKQASATKCSRNNTNQCKIIYFPSLRSNSLHTSPKTTRLPLSTEHKTPWAVFFSFLLTAGKRAQKSTNILTPVALLVRTCGPGHELLQQAPQWRTIAGRKWHSHTGKASRRRSERSPPPSSSRLCPETTERDNCVTNIWPTPSPLLRNN